MDRLRFILEFSCMMLLCQGAQFGKRYYANAAEIDRYRGLLEAVVDDVTVNRTCIQLYVTTVGSSCDNVDLNQQDESYSGLRVALSSMLHACVQFGDDQGIRRLRVLAGSARLYPELYRLGSSFSAASGIPIYFNFSTVVGGTAPLIRAAIARNSVVDTLDMSGGADAFIMGPSYMPNMAQAGKLLDLSQLVASDLQLKWFQIKKYMREQMVVYGNQVVAIPVTTSPVFLYYHASTFKRDGLEVPRTWNAVADLAEAYHGKDLNGDGEPDFGICLTPPNCFIDGYLLQWIFASFVQTHGASSGLILDPLSLSNLANSTAMTAALTVLRRLRLAGPRFGNCTAFEDQYYLRGRCLMSISSTTTFKSAYAPNAAGAGYAAMRGNMGIAPFPGSTRVLERTTGRMVPCTAAICPLATVQAPDEDGILRPVNQPTPSNNVVVMINAQSPAKYQFYAYSLFSYLTSSGVLGATGAALLLDPRLETSPLRDIDLLPEAQAQWVAAGYDPQDVEAFLAACHAAMDNPNQNFESKFVGNLDVTSAFNRGAVMYTNASNPNPPPVSAAVAVIAGSVSLVVQQQGGAEVFAHMYRQTLNWVPPAPPPAPPAPQVTGNVSSGNGDGGDSHRRAAIVVPAVAVPCGVVVLLAIAAAAIGLQCRRRSGRDGMAAAPGAGPDTTLLVTDIQSSTSLWEHLDPEVMNTALSLHHSIIRKAIATWSGYESATEGDSFIVAFRNPTDALLCALEAQQALLEAPWPPELLLYSPLPGLEGDDDPLLPVTALVPSKQQQLQQQQLVALQADSVSNRSGIVAHYFKGSSNKPLARLRRFAGVVSSTASVAASLSTVGRESHVGTPTARSGNLSVSPLAGIHPLEDINELNLSGEGSAEAAAGAGGGAGPGDHQATDVKAVSRILGNAASSPPTLAVSASALSRGPDQPRNIPDRPYNTIAVGFNAVAAEASDTVENKSQFDVFGIGAAGDWEAGRTSPFGRPSVRSDLQAPADGGCGGGGGGGSEAKILEAMSEGGASRLGSGLAYMLGALETGQRETAAIKHSRRTLGSTSSGLEVSPTALSLAASISESVRIVKGRDAIALATVHATATTSPTAAETTKAENPSFRGGNQVRDQSRVQRPLNNSGTTDFTTQQQLPSSVSPMGAPPVLSSSQPQPVMPTMTTTTPVAATAGVLIMPSYPIPAPAAAASTAMAGVTPLFRGLRVRMGIWTGVMNPANVSINGAARRTQYSGEAIVLAKLVSDTVHGGMIVLAEGSRRRLNPDTVRSSRMYLMYCGQHVLNGGSDAAATPLHLYTCYTQALLPRALVVRQMRTAAEIRPGVLVAPVGHGVVVEMRIVGVSTLLAWNRQIVEESLELLHAIALKLLPGSGSSTAEVAASTYIVAGSVSLLDPGLLAATGSGGITATAATPLPGTMILLFSEPEAAVAWAAALRRATKGLTWPTELLDHALTEEVWAAGFSCQSELVSRDTKENLSVITDATGISNAGMMAPAVLAPPPVSGHQVARQVYSGAAATATTGSSSAGGGWRRAASSNIGRRSRFSFNLNSPAKVNQIVSRNAVGERSVVGDDGAAVGSVGSVGDGGGNGSILAYVAGQLRTGSVPSMISRPSLPRRTSYELAAETAGVAPASPAAGALDGPATSPASPRVPATLDDAAEAAAAGADTTAVMRSPDMMAPEVHAKAPNRQPAEAATGQGATLTTAGYSTSHSMTAGSGSVAAVAGAALGAEEAHSDTGPGAVGTNGQTTDLAMGPSSAPRRSPSVPPGPPRGPQVPPHTSCGAELKSEQLNEQAPLHPFDENACASAASTSFSAPGARASALGLGQPGLGVEALGDGDTAHATVGRPDIAGPGGMLPMQLLFRGLRLRWGIAAGPLKGTLVPGDISGQVSYKGKAFAQAAKLASKAKTGQICAALEFTRPLPSFLTEELTIVEKA